MRMKQYSPISSPFGRPEGGFTKEEIDRGLHTLYQDVECPFCQKLQTVASTGFLGGPCVRCGKRTDGYGEAL
jgi:ribosomal protein S27E